MQLPIIIDETRVGTLHIRRQGNCFRAEARLKDMGRVLRLSVYGEGETYLGIPEPREGGMFLEKCLRSLPRNPQYCAERLREAKTEEQNEAPAPRRVLWQGGRAHYF